MRQRRLLFAAVALATASVGLAAISVTAGPGTGCRSGNPLANVQNHKQLKLLSGCESGSGVVRQAKRNTDGDWHMFVAPDAGSTRLMNSRNTQAGGLAVEIVPADQPGCSPGQPVKHGTCSGANLPLPKPGAHINFTGAWVTDLQHGWNEIHPVWKMG
jgi:hypothetical protein